MGQTMDYSTSSHQSAQNLPQGKQSPAKGTEKKAKSSDALPNRAGGMNSIGKPGTKLSREERLRMIEEAAYYRAEQRGFNGGSEMQDWLDAESEINSKFPG